MASLFSGSRSRTANESIQESRSNTAAGAGGTGMVTGRIDSAVVAEISAVLKAGAQVKVFHTYRHFTANPGLFSAHHSQIFVGNLNDDFLFDFGLWMNDQGKVVFDVADPDTRRFYKPSTSYSPNPLQVSPNQLLQAFVATRRKCGPDYKLLHNNCQKYARLFMEELGAKHSRKFFHL